MAAAKNLVRTPTLIITLTFIGLMIKINAKIHALGSVLLSLIPMLQFMCAFVDSSEHLHRMFFAERAEICD